ncbi:hypothetical protein, partial [Neisseria sicca]|uniref:hypothetical protein n=1 Tax=Neisseria sicca TaxID=490 RepID=UPI001C999245
KYWNSYGIKGRVIEKNVWEGMLWGLVGFLIVGGGWGIFGDNWLFVEGEEYGFGAFRFETTLVRTVVWKGLNV